MTTATPDADTQPAIREATEADLLAVFRIEQASFEQPWPFSAFEHYLDAPGFLVADVSGTVVGYVVADVLSTHGQALGHIKDLAVHPEFRGRGCGARLLQRALVTLAIEGAQSVKLEVRAGNETAISLYDEFGFDYFRTAPSYYEDGEDALIMVRDVR